MGIRANLPKMVVRFVWKSVERESVCVCVCVYLIVPNRKSPNGQSAPRILVRFFVYDVCCFVCESHKEPQIICRVHFWRDIDLKHFGIFDFIALWNYKY